MQEQLTTTTVEAEKKPTVRAQKKHVIMFTLACAILVLGILAQLITIHIVMNDVQDMMEYEPPADSENPFAQLGEALAKITAILTMVIGIFSANYVRDAVWAVGLVLSLILDFRYKRIPSWMWVISMILSVVYLAIISWDIIVLVIILLSMLGVNIITGT